MMLRVLANLAAAIPVATLPAATLLAATLLVAAVLVVVIQVAVIPGPAAAHAILMDSDPAARSVLPPGPVTLRLRFNSRIDHQRSRVALRVADAEQVLPIDRGSPADTLFASATLTPGIYVIRWQVLALDGHITRGDVLVTVAGTAPKP